MTYVDGFVASVQTTNRAAWVAHAEANAIIFKEYGALSVVECWGDDVPNGKLTSFPMAVKCQPDETVVFSWITWPSREVRDAAWQKVMTDPRIMAADRPVPFDTKRMIFGGFQALVEG